MTQEYLQQLLSYDPATGEFRWRVTKGQRASTGSIAGCKQVRGYWGIKIDGRLYRAQRLAWFYIHGVWPKMLDHINRIKTDNRLANLREATPSQNQANRKTKGVYLHGSGKWQAIITHNRKRFYLGTFSTLSEAEAIHRETKLKLFGEFAK